MKKYKKYQDLTGKKYGKITVLERHGTFITVDKKTNKKSCRAKWLCKCECGNKVIKNSNELYRRKYTKCKPCAYASRKQSVRRFSAIDRLFKLRVLRRCKKTEIKCKINAKTYFRLASFPCFYCGDLPKPVEIYKGKFALKESLVVHGLDRLNPKKGYEKNNVVSCCFTCNKAKSSLTLKEFTEHIKKICLYQKLMI